MSKSISYNRLKVYELFTSVFLIVVYSLETAELFPLPGRMMQVVVMVAMLLYIAAMVFSAVKTRAAKTVMLDELARKNEWKAAQFTTLMMALAAFAGFVYTKLAQDTVSLSYEVLFMLLIAIIALKNGAYLFLERRGAASATDENED